MFLTVRRLWEVTGASDNAAPSTHKLSHTPPGLSASPAQEDAMDRSIGQEEEGGISFLGGLIPEAVVSDPLQQMAGTSEKLPFAAQLKGNRAIS